MGEVAIDEVRVVPRDGDGHRDPAGWRCGAEGTARARSILGMHLVSIADLRAEVDGTELFASASFGLRTGDRVGVVGPNGVGKSTLLRILAGDRDADGGSVVFRDGTRVAWLEQEPTWPDAPALQVLLEGAPEAREDEGQRLLDRLEIAPDRSTDQMSPGQRRRVALGRTLLAPAEVLLLDEPTNHLDVEMIDWLEQELSRFTGALVMITHDRYLLERVTNRMLDLHRVDAGPARVHWHEGSYASLLEARIERAEREQRDARRARSRLTKEIAWLRRQPRARTSKPRFRVEQVERLRDRATLDAPAATLELGTGRRRLGNDVVELTEVRVHRGDTLVLDGVTLTIGPGERVGIVGPNGAGKSTLLEVLAGRRPADSGTVRIGATVEAGVYTQDTDLGDEDLSVLDSITAIGSHIPLADGSTLPATSLAERFGFEGRLLNTPVGRLSGGERRRLALLHLLVTAPNVLLLDEPTNDLDLDTLTALEDHLDGFSGTLVVTSHDRFVLDRLTDRILAVGDTRVEPFNDLESHRAARRARTGATGDESASGAPSSVGQPSNRERQDARRLRRSLEARVEQLTASRQDIHTRMAEAAADHAALTALQSELAHVDELLATAEEEWLAAAELEESFG